MGLSLHFRNWKALKKIKDCYEGFVAIDEDIDLIFRFQWGRLFMKFEGKDLLGSLHLAGSQCFAVQLW